MRLHTLLAAATCGLVLSAFVLPVSAPVGLAPQDEEHADETPLAQAMHTVEDALKDLRRSVRDPEKHTDALASLVVCQEASIICKTLPPAMLKSVPADKQAEFLKAYRLEMIAFEKALLDLEAAVLEGKDVDTLKEMYTNLKRLEDPAHERFTEDG